MVGFVGVEHVEPHGEQLDGRDVVLLEDVNHNRLGGHARGKLLAA